MAKKNLIHKKNIILVFFVVAYLVLFFSTWKNVFFWDTIQLASKHAHWFYETRFTQLLLPDNADSGHIPVFGAYLAVWWLVFSKSLIVSHLSILPFTIGIIICVHRIVLHLSKPNLLFPAMLLVLSDPTLLAQSTLVSPDIPLVFFFLLAVKAYLKQQNKIFLFSIILLTIISLRGAMVAFAVFLTDMLIIKINNKSYKLIFKKIIGYLPVTIIPVLYFSYHWAEKGWIGYHSESPWNDSFQGVDISGIIRNTVVFVWRIIDFGRIFVWGALIFFTILIVKKIERNKLKTKWQQISIEKPAITFIIILLFTQLLVLAPTMILYKGLLGHRYLLPIFITAALLFIIVVNKYFDNNKWKKLTFIIVSVGLLSGNFWVYPDKIAKGWDATLAHLPYYQLRYKMLTYISARQIGFEKIGSDFPLTAPLKYTDLCDCNTSFAHKNLNKQKYILQSNISNGFTDKELNELKNNWTLVKEYQQCRLYFRLYKQPQNQ